MRCRCILSERRERMGDGRWEMLETDLRLGCLDVGREGSGWEDARP